MDYYIHADSLSQLITDFLRALTLIILEFPAIVWEQPHSCITDTGQVGKPFDPLHRADHIITETPECFCLIVTWPLYSSAVRTSPAAAYPSRCNCGFFHLPVSPGQQRALPALPCIGTDENCWAFSGQKLLCRHKPHGLSKGL